MISAQTLRVCREGKPVSTHRVAARGHAFPDHALKAHRHSDMAARKSQPLIEALGVDAGVMRQKLDQLAALRARLSDRPLHHLFANAAAAAMRGDTDVLDQAARGALR